MPKTKLSDYVLNHLADHGTKYAFVQTGAAISELIDAFTRTERMKDIAVVHEQAGSFASEAYTRVSGKLGVMLATSGPGGINLLNGIANCWYDSIPNLFLTGQINSKFIKNSPLIRQIGFQENDIVAMAKPVTKFAELVRDPSEIRYLLEKAIYMATTGRPGPVLLDIPIDIQKQIIEPEKLEAFSPSEKSEYDNQEQITNKVRGFFNDLEHSERPVILVGGGVHVADVLKEFRHLVSALRIPVATTWGGADVITSDNQFYCGRVGTYGGPGRNFAIQNSDLLLTIGSRISGRITGGVVASFARKAKKYVVDIDKASIDPSLQQIKSDVSIHGDLKKILPVFLENINNQQLKSFEPWLRKTHEWLEKYDTVLPKYYHEKERVNPYVFVRKLSDHLQKNDVIIVDHGGVTAVTYQAFKTKEGQRISGSLGNAPMGYAMSGAMGAFYAQENNGQTICITGDGGFTMNSQELQTLKNYNIPVKTFILNNKVYGIIKQYQETNLNGRYKASGPDGYDPPDFKKVSEAYGIKAVRINNNNEIDSVINEVLSFDGPVVCDVNTFDYFKFEPRIFGWNTPIEDMYPYLPREEFRKNMLIEPMPGWENPIMPPTVKEKR